MKNYRWIDYPSDLDAETKARYERAADLIEANTTEPIALVWANELEDWVDERGHNPPRDCLLITKLVEMPGEPFGQNLMSVILH